MDDDRGVGALLEARMAELGLTVRDLRELLFEAGHGAGGAKPIERQVVHGWLRTGRLRQDALLALFQVLRLPMADRRAWAAAAGFGELVAAVTDPAVPC